MKAWGKIFKKQINAETSRQDTYRLVANVNADIEDKPKLVLEIEDTGIARTKLVTSTMESGSTKEPEKKSNKGDSDSVDLPSRIIIGFFFLVAFYFLAVVKLSIDIPMKFKSFQDDNLPLTEKIDQIVSPEGLWTWNLVPIIAFLALGFLLHSLEYSKNAEYLKVTWYKMVAISITVLTILVTIFSVWS